MKKLLITTLSLLLFLPLVVKSEEFNIKNLKKERRIELHLNNSFTTVSSPSSLGPGLLLAGASLLTMGLLTQNDYTVGVGGKRTDRPFFDQGPKMLAVLSGITSMGVGVVITIGGRSR